METPSFARMDAADDKSRLARFGGRNAAEATKRWNRYVALLDAHTGAITDEVRARCEAIARKTFSPEGR